MSKDPYICTMRIAPELRAQIKLVVAQLKTHNPRWGETPFIHVALSAWVEKISKLNDREIDRLLGDYLEFLEEHGK